MLPYNNIKTNNYGRHLYLVDLGTQHMLTMECLSCFGCIKINNHIEASQAKYFFKELNAYKYHKHMYHITIWYILV